MTTDPRLNTINFWGGHVHIKQDEKLAGRFKSSAVEEKKETHSQNAPSDDYWTVQTVKHATAKWEHLQASSNRPRRMSRRSHFDEPDIAHETTVQTHRCVSATQVNFIYRTF